MPYRDWGILAIKAGIRMLQNSHHSLELSHYAEAISVVHRQRFEAGKGIKLEADPLAVEAPLQISLQWWDGQSGQERSQEWSLTMRTPGDDIALVTGLLLTQQVVSDVSQIEAIAPADEQGRHAGNHLLVTLAKGIEPDWALLSRSYASQSSCGICGLTSMRALSLRQPAELDKAPAWLHTEKVILMPQLLRASQPLFEHTGAVHGAGYFTNNQLVAVAEDVGRHNAVDKLIGHIHSHQLFLAQGVLVLSGRVSFELMQKALIAGIPVIVAVGAPSSLAIEMARQFDITLIGFTKTHQFNVYHGHWRLQPAKTIEEVNV